MHYVTHRNGNRLYISDPPDQVEGYIKDGDNPFLFRPDYPPCRFRLKRKCGTCSNAREDYYCTELRIDKYLPCLTCDKREEVLSSPHPTTKKRI
jgi:hypothetical protein